MVNQINKTTSKNRDTTLVRINSTLHNEIKQRAGQVGLPIKTVVELCLNEELGLLNNKFFINALTKEVINEK